MRICFIGSSNTLFTHKYLEFLSNSNDISELSFIDVGKEKKQKIAHNINVTHLYSENLKSNETSKLKRILKKFSLDRLFLLDFLLKIKEFLPLNKTAQNKIIKHLELTKPELIIYFWSTTIRKEKKFIDKYYGGKSILIVNTYPVRGTTKFNEKSIYIKFDRAFFHSFTGVILPSIEMSNFLELNSIHLKNFIIQPDMLANYHPEHNKRYYKNSSKKRLLFLGNSFFNSRTIDDVSGKLIELADNNIEVFVQHSLDALTYPALTTFPPFSFEDIRSGLLYEYLLNFDGIILTYNTLPTARTYSSFPTRFALAIQNDIPVYLEKGMYPAIERQFVGLVHTYSSINELVSMINSGKFKNTFNTFRFISQAEGNFMDFIKKCF